MRRNSLSSYFASVVGWIGAFSISLLHGSDGPLSPIKSIESIRIDPALSIQLVASEPMVMDPVAVCWDAHGAMYVAEMGDYPASESGGRIKRLVDRDSDGMADEVSTFVADVSYPTSVLPYRDGILVAAAPDILWFRDSDHDGIADIKQVVLTGFGTGNQQLRVNGLMWGLDNYVYGANGRSDGEIGFVSKEGQRTSPALSIRNSDFRFNPSGQVSLSGGFSQFGHSFDDYGNRFISWNTIHIRHVVMEQSYLSNNPRAPVTATAREVSNSGSTPRVYPISQTTFRFNQEPPGFFNASCGLTIYRGELLGPDFAGNAFACEPLSNLVHRDTLTSQGLSFLAQKPDTETNREFLASHDTWFRPVNLATGPDGSLVVVDFYRKWVEHPQWVADQAAKTSVDFSEGKEYGRIYRIVPKQMESSSPTWSLNLDSLTSIELVRELSNANAWRRETAQRLLVERDIDEAILNSLEDLIGNKDSFELARLHALGVLLGTNKLREATILRALSDVKTSVRRFAVQLAESFLSAQSVVDRLYELALDPNEAVQFQVACSLGKGPRTGATATALSKILTQGSSDPWIRQAIFTAAAGLSVEVVQYLSTSDFQLENADAECVHWLIELIRSEAMARQSDWVKLTKSGDLPQNRRELIVLALLRTASDAASRKSILDELAFAPHDALQVKHTALTPGLPLSSRMVATSLMEYVESPNWTESLLMLMAPSQPIDIQLCAAKVASSRPATEIGPLMQKAFLNASPAVRRSLLDSMTGRKELRSELVRSLTNGTMDPKGLDQLQRQLLLDRVDTIEREKLVHLFETKSTGNRTEIVQRYVQHISQASEAASSQSINLGRQIYQKNCQGCHARNGQGNRVGPDLTAVAGRSPQDILMDILDPNRSVSEDGISYAVLTDDERILTGIIASESSTSVSLKQAGGSIETVLRSDIQEWKRLGKSLMPEGFDDSITPEEMSSLILFLKSPTAE